MLACRVQQVRMLEVVLTASPDQRVQLSEAVRLLSLEQ